VLSRNRQLVQKSNMKISIITVVYNNEATISSAIESVLSQTYKDKEYIVIDGGSTDGTLDKINQYRSQIDIFVSEPDKGIYDAMNKGLTKATGDVVCILNSDDLYPHEHVIERVAKELNASGSDAVYGDLVYVSPDDVNRVTRYWKSGNFKTKSFKYGWMPPHPAFFVKKSVYDKYGHFNTKLKSAADYELMLRFVYKNEIKLAYFPEVLVKMRTGGLSNSSLKNRLMANKEDKAAWEINGLKPYVFTLYLKPLRKVIQYIQRPVPDSRILIKRFGYIRIFK
jgi:glycosyltransferase involved in cell wall biosynthesis